MQSLNKIKEMKIPFSPPYIDQSVIDEVTDSLSSGWITTGPKVKALEKAVANFSNVEHVLCTNSWTSAAILSLTWLGIKPGDEVIIPAYTYCATALAVIHAGGKPIIVDVGDDFNIDVTAIKKAITRNTKAIIPVDFAGFPCDYEAIMKIVESGTNINKFEPNSDVQEKLGRIMVISDAAHSLGATYKEKNLGSEADFTIFSFHAVKNITTAEGGAICINLPNTFSNEEIYAQLRLRTLNCQTKDAFSKSKAGGWRYDIVGLGMKINMADVNAAIGLAQMRLYKDQIEKRKVIFEKYLAGFNTFEWAKSPSIGDEERHSSCHIFALRINGISESKRDAMIDFLANMGISVNVHFIPLPMLSYFKELGFDIESTPNAYKNYCQEITLPIYPQLTDVQIDYIIKGVQKAYINA